MQFISTHTTRLGRSVAAMLTTAAVLAIGGCQSGPVSNDTMGGGSNNSGGSGGTTVAGSASTTPGGSSTDSKSSSAPANNSGMGMMGPTAQYFPMGVKSGEVLLVEADGPKSVRLNHDVTYNVKVTNLTDNAVHNIMLQSTNPDGFQVTGAQMATTQPMDKGMGYAVGDLAAHESKTVMITGMATKVGMVDTCYTVTYNPPTLCTMLQVTNPAIELSVQAPADSDICQPLTYTYTVKNTGTGTAKNVTLEETLPDGLMTADGGKTVTNTIGDIPQGESRTYTAQLKPGKVGSYNGSAVAKADGDAAPAATTMTNIHAPVLAVAVTGGQTDYVGKSVDYQITVTNKGDAVAKNAMVQIGHKADGIGTVTSTDVDSTGMIPLGDLAPGASVTKTAQATSTQGGTVTVMAKAKATCAEDQMASADTMFNTIPALLLETVDEVDPVKVGSNVIYDVKVTNQGSGPDNNVVVTATIPDGEEYVSTDGPTQPTVSGQTLTFPTIPSLQTKGSATWKVTVKANKAQDVQFKTTASCDGAAPAEKVEPTKLY